MGPLKVEARFATCVELQVEMSNLKQSEVERMYFVRVLVSLVDGSTEQLETHAKSSLHLTALAMVELQHGSIRAPGSRW